VNLEVVRESVRAGHVPGKFDWNKTWVADILLSGEEQVKREKDLERLRGITPDVKRRNEIKAGVITASVGVGVMVFLYIFMQGIILSGQAKPGEGEILSRVWIAGFIPLMVGLALIINGAFVSKLFGGAEERRDEPITRELPGKPAGEYLPPGDTSELFPAGFSVTDETTAHLKVPREGK